MAKFLSWVWADWSRAPISGTLAIVLAIAVLAHFLRGDIDRGLLFLILLGQVNAQRGPLNG